MTQATIHPKFIDHGHYFVTVRTDHGWNILGDFHTTDMQLIDDINELNKEGFEDNLVMHDTFEEVHETVLTLLNKA